ALRTGATLWTQQAARTPIEGIVFSPDGRLVAAWTSYGPFTVRDSATGREVAAAETPGPVRGLAVAPRGGLLAVAGPRRGAALDPASDAVRHLMSVHPSAVGVAFSRDGAALIAVRQDGAVSSHAAMTGARLRAARLPTSLAASAFAARPSILATIPAGESSS